MKFGWYYYIKSFCSTWGNRNSTLESTPATRIADVTKDIFEACGEEIFLNGVPIWTTSAHFEVSKTIRKYPNLYGLIRSYAKDPKALPTGILAHKVTFKDKDSEAIEFSLSRDQIKLDLPTPPETGPFPIAFIGACIKRYNKKWQVSARLVLFNTSDMATPNFFRDTNLDYVMINHETQEAWTANYTRIRAWEIPNILNNLKPNERKSVQFLAIFEDVDLAGSGIYHGCSRLGCPCKLSSNLMVEFFFARNVEPSINKKSFTLWKIAEFAQESKFMPTISKPQWRCGTKERRRLQQTQENDFCTRAASAIHKPSVLIKFWKWERVEKWTSKARWILQMETETSTSNRWKW